MRPPEPQSFGGFFCPAPVHTLYTSCHTGRQLRENIKKGVFVDGLVEQVVTNAAEAYDV